MQKLAVIAIFGVLSICCESPSTRETRGNNTVLSITYKGNDRFRELSTRAFNAELQGDWETVYILSKELIKADPTQYDGYFELGFYYFYKNDFEHSIEYFKKSLEIEPNASRGWRTLAICYEKLGRKEDALYASQMAIKAEEAWAQKRKAKKN